MSLKDLKKTLTKKGIATTMNEPTKWVCSGNYAMNLRLSGRFDVGIPNKRCTLFWGESGSGKSFLTSRIVKNCQDAGYKTIYIDTEDSIMEEFMVKIGVDMSEDMFLPIRVGTIEEATDTVSHLFTSLDKEEKVCIVIDSLSALISDKEGKEFEKGIQKGDMGQKAKKLKLLVQNINRKCSEYDMFFLMTAHAYLNQDLLNGEGKWVLSGGKGLQFMPSISCLLTKLKLKEGTDIVGVRIKVTATKTRFTQTHGMVELNVPYATGVDPIDGLLQICTDAGLVKQSGAWYSYEDDDGNDVKFQSKNFDKHYGNILTFEDDDQIIEIPDHIEPEKKKPKAKTKAKK